MLTVNPQGHSGGIALLWKEKDRVQLRSYSNNYIDVEISSVSRENWRLTGIYEDPDRTQRRKTCALLRNLAIDSNFPWCANGDFNNVTSLQDKTEVHCIQHGRWTVLMKFL